LFLSEFFYFIFGEINRLCDLNASRADPGAFEPTLAGPNPIRIVQLRQPLLETIVPAVIVEAGSLDYGSGSEKVGIDLPDNGTGGIARHT
jgi:hypothetical protein